MSTASLSLLHSNDHNGRIIGVFTTSRHVLTFGRWICGRAIRHNAEFTQIFICSRSFAPNLRPIEETLMV